MSDELELTKALEEIVRLENENAALRDIIDSENHVAVFDKFGWALEHNWQCRVNKTMTTCRFDGALNRYCSGGAGTYRQEELARGHRYVLSFDDTPQRRLLLTLESEEG